MAEGFDELFGTDRLMVILRGLSPERTVALATAAWEAGAGQVEVPIGRPEQVASLVAAVAAGRERGRRVGAGTVVSAESVRAAADAGAAYTVAPGFDPDVLRASLAADMPHLPGVATPSEVQRAVKAGCRWLKAFPAVVLTPAWFTAVHGPFPDVSFVATGGVTAGSAPAFLNAGVRVVGVGSALADSDRNAELELLSGRLAVHR